MTPDVYVCKACGAIVGTFVEVDWRGKRQVWLKLSAVTVSKLHGRCDCGNEVWWEYTDRMLEKIVNRLSTAQADLDKIGG